MKMSQQRENVKIRTQTAIQGIPLTMSASSLPQQSAALLFVRYQP